MSAFWQDAVFQWRAPILVGTGGVAESGRIAKLNTPADDELLLNGMPMSQKSSAA
jgi:hypothetical protein